MQTRRVVPTTFIPDFTVQEAIHKFLSAKSSEGRRPGTIASYTFTTLELAHYLGADRLILSVDAEDLREFFGSLRDAHNTGGVHLYYRNVKAFFRWYWLEYEIGKFNPIEKVRVESQKPVPKRGIPLADLSKLLEACVTINRLRDRAILLGLLDTCARGSEFCAFSIRDVDQDTGQALIRDGKGGKSRYVRFGIKSLRALKRYLRARGAVHFTEPLIATDEGSYFKYRALHRLVQRRIEAAGTPQYGLHDFRRRGLYELWLRIRDIKSVSVYAGHTNTSVTQVYLGITDQDIMEAHSRGSPVDHLL